MAKCKFVWILAAATLLASARTPAGTLEPELEEVIEGLEPGDFVDVLVRCTDSVDPHEFQDPDVEARAEAMIRALQNQSRACYTSLSNNLENTSSVTPAELWIANAVAARVPVAELDGLANRAGVASIGLDDTFELPEPVLSASESSGPALPEWNIDAIRAPELWGLGFDGSGILVGTLDTGVDPDHPDISPNWRGGANSWYDPNGEHPNTPYDSDGHGTWSMGLLVGGGLGGSIIGVAPGAQWIAAKIFDDRGRARLSRIHQGFQWLLDPDGDPATPDAPDVVDNSWYLSNTVDQCNAEFAPDIAILKAVEIGVVFSAGNTGPNPQTSVSPSNDPQSLAVGAVDVFGNVADFSARGPSACGGGIYYPRVMTPGVGVRTADRTFGGLFPLSYLSVSGTSFSAPHVAGGMALLKDAFSGASISEIESAIEESAQDLDPPGPDGDSGFGLLDLYGAYTWLMNNPPSPEPGELQFGAASFSADENAGNVLVTVTRTGGDAGQVTVGYATADDTASAGEDYQATTGTLTFPDGETGRSFSVPILDDPDAEGDESFALILENPTGGALLGNPVDVLVTILDDDAADSDGDGVIDALDSCPSTPAGEPVDADGCSASQLDSDGDGISDALDLCPGTPFGTLVDEVGCPAGPADADGDGFDANQDCNDGDGTIYPGAPEIKHDGVDQDCNGYDLTIEVLSALYKSNGDKLSVEASSDLGTSADLQLEGYGPMKWSKQAARWTISVPGAGGNPQTVTVSGAEGSESALVVTN
jgi:serine protease AprX